MCWEAVSIGTEGMWKWSPKAADAQHHLPGGPQFHLSKNAGRCAWAPAVKPFLLGGEGFSSLYLCAAVRAEPRAARGNPMRQHEEAFGLSDLPDEISSFCFGL